MRSKPHIERFITRCGQPTSWWKCSMRVKGRVLNLTLTQVGPTPVEAYNALARWQRLPQ